MKKLLAAALLSVAVAPAFAADSGLYAGVDVGSGKIRLSNCGVGGCGSSSKDNDTVGGVLLGYQYNKNLAVEAKYTGGGKWVNAAGTGDVKNDAFALVAVGIAPMTDSFSLYGKLGIASNQTKVSNTAVMGVQDTRRTAATYGVGAQYNATPTVGIRLGYDRYSGKADITTGGSVDVDSDVWAIGVVFKF